MSGVKDMDGASFMSVRVSAAEALVTQILEGSNSHSTHSKSIFTSNHFNEMHTNIHACTVTHTNKVTSCLKSMLSLWTGVAAQQHH